MITLVLLAALQAPDVLFVNGKIVTVDDTFSIAEAVAVRAERVLARGTNAEIRALAGPDTVVLDLGDRTVLPGLIDNHNHFIRATEHWLHEARLDGVRTRAESLAVLKAKADSLDSGEWLFSLGGWFEDQFAGDQRGFTLEELDAVAPGNPAFVQALYHHAFVNTAWLEAMGFPRVASREEIAGARGLAADVVRDRNGRATGRLEGGFAMIGRAIARFPEVSEAEQVESIRMAMRHYNRLGLTTVYDPGGLGIQEESYRRIGRLAEAGELTLRVFHTLWGGLDPARAGETIERLESERPFEGSEIFQRIALGEVYHAGFHFDSTSTFVSPTESDIEMAGTILSIAAARGWPVQTHAVQPQTMGRLFDLAEKIAETHPVRALRWAITHADHIGAPEIERARNLGMNVQLRSTPVVGGQGEAIRVHGDAVKDMPPLRLVQDSGISWGLGTDGTKAAQIDPFVTLWWATTGKRLDGEAVTRQILTREEALVAHTRSNALLMFQEANLGAIKPGLLADLIVLDRDYLTIPLDEIRDIEVVGTIVSGKVVFRSDEWR